MHNVYVNAASLSVLTVCKGGIHQVVTGGPAGLLFAPSRGLAREGLQEDGGVSRRDPPEFGPPILIGST